MFHEVWTKVKQMQCQFFVAEAELVQRLASKNLILLLLLKCFIIRINLMFPADTNTWVRIFPQSMCSKLKLAFAVPWWPLAFVVSIEFWRTHVSPLVPELTVSKYIFAQPRDLPMLDLA